MKQRCTNSCTAAVAWTMREAAMQAPISTSIRKWAKTSSGLSHRCAPGSGSPASR